MNDKPRSGSEPSRWTSFEKSQNHSVGEGSHRVGRKNHPKLSRRKPWELLGVARSSVSDQAVPEDPEDIRIKRLLGNR